MSLKSSSSKLCLVSGLLVAAAVIVSSPSSVSLAEACGCAHDHPSPHSQGEETPVDAMCDGRTHHDRNNERDTVASPSLESVGLDVHKTLMGDRKEAKKVDDGAEDVFEGEEQHQGGCPFDHHNHDHHHHHEGHEEDDHHHHHHHHHEHHEHDHHHHDHEHHPSSSSSVNDYDWVATVRDKESGEVKHEVPILLMHKESGIARFTPLTFEHYMKRGKNKQQPQQQQQHASFVDSNLKEGVVDDGDAAASSEKRKEGGPASASSSPSSSTALASLIFYYTTPCGGLCEDSYKLYVAAASALNKAMAESLVTIVGNRKENLEENRHSSSVASSSSSSSSDKTSSSTTSFIARAKKFIESKLLTAQFYIPKASKTQEDAYYHHNQHKAASSSSSSSSSPLPRGAFVPASPSYYPVVAHHGVRGSVITNDFPLITIEINSPKSKSDVHVAEGNEGIIGFTGSLTPWSLWFDGVRPVLYAEHKLYCDGLAEIKALLVRAASKGTTAPTPSEEIQNSVDKKDGTASPTPYSKGTKGSLTPQDVSTVLSSVPDHDLWVTFCDLLAEGPEQTVSNRDVTATTEEEATPYTSDCTDASGDSTSPSAGGAPSSVEGAMSRSVGQIFKSRLTATTRNCAPQREEEKPKSDADVDEKDTSVTRDAANSNGADLEGMDDVVASVHATIDEAEAVRVINITDYAFENGLLA